MTPTTEDLLTTCSDVLVRMAGDDPALRLVVGTDPGPAAWLIQVWPDRVLRAPGATSRLAVAEGVAVAGGRPVVVLDHGSTDLVGVPARGPLVMLTDRPHHLGAAYRAAVTAVQPAWRTDIAPLLEGALRHDRPVVVRLHDRPLPIPRANQADPPTFGEHRILHRGSRGLVIGAGRTAPMLAEVARQLAVRELHVTAVDAHTIRPGTGIDPAALDAHLLVGPLSTGHAEALTPVRVDEADPHGTARRVLEAIRRRS